MTSRMLPRRRGLLVTSDTTRFEKCLAHEDGRSSRGIYNKAEYEHQRRHMIQEWSNLVDAWVAGRKYTPTLYPPTMDLLTPEPDV